MEHQDLTPSARPRHILVAEDDDEMRELLREVLQKRGYIVEDVEDGFELQDFLAACIPSGPLPCPDLIISDIRMPGQTALEVLRKLGRPPTKVLLITAFSDTATQFQGRVLGASAVLDKPVDMELLIDTVDGLLPPRG